MSKWNKGHGLIVPIDSLLKEKENTNRPAPLRSAGLVGRWGITSFTSIRNTSYEFESTSPKESDDLNCPSSVASLSTQVPNPIKPKKFFKSRNTLPPVAATPDPHRDAAGYGSPQQKNVLLHQAAQLQARIAQDAGGSPPYVPAGYYQPLGASTSAEGKAPGKKKSKKKKQKQSEGEAGEESAVPTEKPSSAKKEKPESKKEKKQKKVKKEVELPPELPKRNSSRIRNKVVNYNEDDDSFDMIPYRDEVSRTPPVSKLALEPAPVPVVPEPEPEPVEKSVAEEEDEEEVEEEDDEEQEVPQEEAPAPGGSVTKSVGTVGMPVPAGLASPTKASSGGEERVKTREHKEMKTVPVPLPSPSVVEHPPIVLRISKVGIGSVRKEGDRSESVLTASCKVKRKASTRALLECYV
ncbi:hypothetical protein RP20_CCG007718 [Aedes albopictus]|nr:hypothetical protein RP20_CCG007718 [Aedes albopictus]